METDINSKTYTSMVKIAKILTDKGLPPNVRSDILYEVAMALTAKDRKYQALLNAIRKIRTMCHCGGVMEAQKVNSTEVKWECFSCKNTVTNKWNIPKSQLN